jgi:ATP-dependent RNA helicase DDX1
LEPTHELASQTHNVIASFKEYLPPPAIDQLLIVGGQNVADQLKSIQKGVDIITATPGRIIELVESGSLDLSSVRFFVLDEADQLINQNYPGIMKLFNAIPKSPTLQVSYSSSIITH